MKCLDQKLSRCETEVAPFTIKRLGIMNRFNAFFASAKSHTESSPKGCDDIPIVVKVPDEDLSYFK
jgi:hypothetical protein